MSAGLRLVAVDGRLVGPPPPPARLGRGNVELALAQLRLAVAVVESEPADLNRGYSHDELAAQYAAVDRMVKAFHVLDAALGHPGAVAVSENGHRKPSQPPRETRRNGVRK